MRRKGTPIFGRAAVSAAVLLAAALLGSIGGKPGIDPAQAAPPPNDNFPGTAVGAVPYSDTQDTTMATSEGGEPLFCGANTKTVWYSFTIPVTGAYSFDTFGSDFATVMNVYTGASLGTLSLSTCTGATNNQFQSHVITGGPAGTVFRIQIAGNGSVAGGMRTDGNLRFHITKFDTGRTVNSTNDVDDTVCDGTHCSLREAINAANASADTTQISFAIASGAQTITLASALPAVSTRTIIDGSTQPGATSAPLIEVDATGAGGNGLTLTAGNSLVTGLVINRAPGYGIELSGGAGNVISGNYIGTNAAGTAASANVTGGINVSGVGDNVIGAGLDRQVISGNGSSAGIRIFGAGATSNRVQGNYIGTNAAGTGAVGNAFDGVLLQSGPASNLVGGAISGGFALERNVISGNGSNGVLLTSAGTANTVIGNYIGTNATATAAIGNAGNGVRVRTTNGSLIGGITPSERNIISGNGFTASGSGVSVAVGSSANTVRGNWIGLQSDGLTALGNAQAGIFIDASPSNLIGDPANALPNTCVGGCNLIEYNDRGVEITGAASTGNVVRSNAALYNTAAGLRIQGLASSNTIGGSGSGNLWSGSDAGIELKGGASSNTFMLNQVGTDPFGTSAIPNDIGIRIHEGSDDNVIGGTVPFSESNLISGNAGPGVFIFQSHENIIRNNGIGGDINGTAALPNVVGVHIIDADDNVIGGAAANLISGNTAFGVAIEGGAGSSDGNTVSANLIGTTITGNAALPNLGGVLINSGSSNTIGGPAAADRNVISGNTVDGVYLFGVSGNTVRGNLIGIRLDGTGAVPNGGNGVLIDGGADNNDIGPDNVISGNTGRGVRITDDSDGTLITENLIGTNPSATGALGNLQGVLIEDGSDATTIHLNTIAGNGDGIELLNVAGTVIVRNTIGTSAAPNTSNGLYMTGVSTTVVGTTSCCIPVGNVIAFNGTRGVVLNSGSASVYGENSIHSNGTLGIDLNNDGVTANDVGDADGGANGSLNYPVVASAGSGVSSGSLIQGTLNSAASTSFEVWLYSSPSCDPSGYGEGQTVLGKVAVTTNGSGNATFSRASASPIPIGHAVTALTADVGNFRSSEFSQCTTVTACAGDADCDGFLDPAPGLHEGPANTSTAVDNCGGLWNPTQTNADGNFIDLTPPKANDDRTWINSDALGDECDTDDDNDGRTDAAESTGCNGGGATNPLLADSDGDRRLDGPECTYGSNPTNPASVPGAPCTGSPTDTDADGVNDNLELCFYGSNPGSANTDGTTEFVIPGALYCSDGREVASVDTNRVVNAADLGAVSSAILPLGPYGTPPAPGNQWKVAMDMDKNGVVNAADLGRVAAQQIISSGSCP